MTPLRDRVLSVVGAVLRVPPSNLDETSSPDTVDSWDSLQHLQVVLALEEEFGVQFSPDDIDRLQTVGAILLSIEARRPDGAGGRGES